MSVTTSRFGHDAGPRTEIAAAEAAFPRLAASKTSVPRASSARKTPECVSPAAVGVDHLRLEGVDEFRFAAFHQDSAAACAVTYDDASSTGALRERLNRLVQRVLAGQHCCFDLVTERPIGALEDPLEVLLWDVHHAIARIEGDHDVVTQS